jgi:formylglycine-generating enzyme required for sulfatase activity
MNSRVLWSRILVIAGCIAMLAGPLHPLDWLGAHLILPGSGMVALGMFLGKDQRGIIRYGMLRIFILLTVIVGALFVLSAVEAIEPQDFGLLLILPGSGMVVLGSLLGKGQRGMIRYWIWVFILVAVSIGAVIAAIAAEHLGGHTLRRLAGWEEVMVVPYAIGCIMGYAGILVMLVRFFRSKLKGHIIIPSGRWVWRFLLGCAVAGIIAGTGWMILTRSPKVSSATKVPSDMVLIPAGSFTMGDVLGDESPPDREIPTHTVAVSAFYLDRYEVTMALWDEVYTWAIAHGYTFGGTGWGKGTNHPVSRVSWYDAVKWCNARSEKEGRIPAYYTSAAQTTVYRSDPGTSVPYMMDVQNDWVKWNLGYRLPTEAEWEYAARGGLSGQRFPWGDTISQSQANYYSTNSYRYDVSPTRGYHPNDQSGGEPYTSPVGSFAPNAYGLYDMAGNMLEWCWDQYGSYSSDSQTDPRGPSSGLIRVCRSGFCGGPADFCRVARRNGYATVGYGAGFRCALPSDQIARK